MDIKTPGALYKGYRFPPEIISYCVWLYYRFPLSYRDIEELMAEQGIMLTYETVRKWCLKFGQRYAKELRHRRSHPGDQWHLDEVFVTIKGQVYYVWRAVDQCGTILGVLVQSRRDEKAAQKFLRKLLKDLQYVPRVLITDKLASYAAAKWELLPDVEHRQQKRLNNRAENSHQPTRQRERTMRRFKSPGQTQRFLSAFGPISSHFRPRRHTLRAVNYRQEMKQRFVIWEEVTGLPSVASPDEQTRRKCLPSSPSRLLSK